MSTHRKTQLKELSADECGKISRKVRKDIDQIAEWREEGRCPYCGELGKYVGFQPVCSVHGPYSSKAPKKDVDEPFDGGDPPYDN